MSRTASICISPGTLSPPSFGASQASTRPRKHLGHADLNTTLGIYGHRDQSDLEVAMEAYASWLEQQREDSIVPPEADS